MYGVCRQTLGKWIRYFAKKIPYSQWKRWRKLAWVQVQAVFQALGDPSTGECLTKKQIIEACESDYRTIAGMVNKRASDLEFDIVVYNAVDIYPPLITQRMIRIL